MNYEVILTAKSETWQNLNYANPRGAQLTQALFQIFKRYYTKLTTPALPIED